MKNSYFVWFCYSMALIDYTRLVARWCQEDFGAVVAVGAFVLAWVALGRWYTSLDGVEARP